ncbi:hypothetical protein Tco_0588092 [Tanacetum coccineum]
MSTTKFAKTHNLVAFLEKPKESNGFEGIIDFLNASSIKYALMVNPTVYESCIQQFWANAKAKTVNGARQIQALVDKKKVIITKKSVRSDLMLEDAEGTECLPNDVIFEQLTLMGFLWENHPLFQTMMVQALEDMGEDSASHTDSYSTPIITQPSSSKPQKKKSRRKQRKDSGLTKPIPDVATNEEPTSTPSCDLPQSGEDILQLAELMTLCTKLQKQVLDLEEAKTAQAKEISSLKKRVKQLEKSRKSRTSGLKRLRKVGLVTRVESSNNDSLGAQEDASKQGRKIADLDADEEMTLIDETQERNNKEMLFDVEDELQVTTPSAPTTTIDELTLVQTLIEINAAKPKAVTSAATTTTPTRPKARGVAKDKSKAKMIESEKPLKKKDQIVMDEEVARNLEAQLQAELKEEERLSRLKEEEANISLLES